MTRASHTNKQQQQQNTTNGSVYIRWKKSFSWEKDTVTKDTDNICKFWKTGKILVLRMTNLKNLYQYTATTKISDNILKINYSP